MKIMSDTLVLAMWFVGIPATLVAGMLVVWAIEWTLMKAENAAAQCQVALTGWRYATHQKSQQTADRQEFLAWLAARTGTSPMGSTVDGRLVDAQQQAELIRVLIEEELPKTILNCVETHRLIARITGAYHLSEIAYEPECHQLRAGVVWMLSHTTALLDGYPLRFEDKRLLHNSLILRKRALPTCRRCPYIKLETEAAPHLCPTAELVDIKGAKRENGNG